MAVLNTNTRYLHPSILRYAERLTATLPEPLSVCFFVCSGSEANELALRMARATTGRPRRRRPGRRVPRQHAGPRRREPVQVRRARRSGRAGVGAQGADARRLPRPLPPRGPRARGEVRGARRRGRARPRDGGRPAGRLPVREPPVVRRADRAAAAATSPRPTATRARPAPSASPTRCRSASAASAATSGASRRRASCPDIVTLGKPIGNGHPLGAVVTTPRDRGGVRQRHGVLQHLRRQPRVLRDRPGGARRDSGRAAAGPRAACRRNALARPRSASRSGTRRSGDVRGLGLFLGIELVRDRAARTPAAAMAGYVVERMKDHGILLSTDGPDHNVIKMKPPLIFRRGGRRARPRGLRPRALGRLREVA